MIDHSIDWVINNDFIERPSEAQYLGIIYCITLISWLLTQHDGSSFGRWITWLTFTSHFYWQSASHKQILNALFAIFGGHLLEAAHAMWHNGKHYQLVGEFSLSMAWWSNYALVGLWERFTNKLNLHSAMFSPPEFPPSLVTLGDLNRLFATSFFSISVNMALLMLVNQSALDLSSQLQLLLWEHHLMIWCGYHGILYNILIWSLIMTFTSPEITSVTLVEFTWL